MPPRQELTLLDKELCSLSRNIFGRPGQPAPPDAFEEAEAMEAAGGEGEGESAAPPTDPRSIAAADRYHLNVVQRLMCTSLEVRARSICEMHVCKA